MSILNSVISAYTSSAKTPWANLLIMSGSLEHSPTRFVISHNSPGHVAQFLLRSFLELRRVPKLIMEYSKILCMDVASLHFLDSFNYLPMSLNSMPKTFDVTCK